MVYCAYTQCVFFSSRRRHTRFDCDWSSDVCSSDLTTESQTHREMASGLSMPVGFKNATDGSLQIAIDAMTSARAPHSFLGIDQDGVTSIIRTTGNPDGHVVLRGGRLQTNYDSASIATAVPTLKKAALPSVLMV